MNLFQMVENCRATCRDSPPCKSWEYLSARPERLGGLSENDGYNYGKSPFLMGKLTISMAIFNSYVSLPEGNIANFNGEHHLLPNFSWWFGLVSDPIADTPKWPMGCGPLFLRLRRWLIVIFPIKIAIHWRVYPIVVSPWKKRTKSMFQGLNSARFTIVRQTQISSGYLYLCIHT